MDTSTPSPKTATAGSTASAPSATGASLIDTYIRLFVVNRTKYLSAKDSTWFTAKKKLTDSRIESALRGREHLGLMPVSTSGTSLWVAWDADTDGQAQALMQHIALLPQGATIIERSRRGIHLLRLFDAPVPWDAALRLGQAYAIKCGIPEVEIYPTGRNSRGLRAPLTKHPKTGEVYGWLSREGELIDPWETLNQLVPAPIDARWLIQPVQKTHQLERRMELPGIIGQLGSYADLLAEVSRYTRMTEKGGEQARGCCPFHDDHNPSFTMLHGFWRCWTGCGEGSIADFRKLVKERGL